ncbi:MAG TPA: spore coat U domain-containing protein, partial [Thermodesulfobacteriota bacterium]|nr:spore coat U domain-containing protein [Thermodesulfobacteriota bacterium]
NCRMVSVTDIVFSTAYDPTDSANNDSGAGDFSFRCTRGTDYNMYITGARTMTDGTDTLAYELYKEGGRTTVWPSVNPATPTTSGDNSPVIMDVFGRISALQDVQAGPYAGSVTVTVEW